MVLSEQWGRWFRWPRLLISLSVGAGVGWCLGTFAPFWLMVVVYCLGLIWMVWQLYDIRGMRHGRYILVHGVDEQEFLPSLMRFRRRSDALQFARKLNQEIDDPDLAWKVLDRPRKQVDEFAESRGPGDGINQ